MDNRIILTPSEALLTILDAIDYKAGNCSGTDMVAAVLPEVLIDNARTTLKEAHRNE